MMVPLSLIESLAFVSFVSVLGSHYTLQCIHYAFSREGRKMNLLKQVQLCGFVSTGHQCVHEFDTGSNKEVELLLLWQFLYYYYFLFENSILLSQLQINL